MKLSFRKTFIGSNLPVCKLVFVLNYSEFISDNKVPLKSAREKTMKTKLFAEKQLK